MQDGRSPETAILLDTIDYTIEAERVLPYQPSAERIIDVIHLELDVRFGWAEEEVYGTAKTRITPYFEAQDSTFLDAKGFSISRVEWSQNDSIQTVEYRYDNKQIAIANPTRLNPGDTATVIVEYVAQPSKLEKGEGRAVTANQGLYFINPTNEIKDKPRQIWTQGETEFNSGWFPCVDKPNEKFTQEIFITVDTSLQTISNGKLMYASLNEDGTRTDYWKQSDPHSGYLVMIAVGTFAEIKDSWNGIPLSYFVEEEYAEHAETIFGNTPEMLTFYSDLLQYPFPWDKYYQVVVEDFVSGAMENTSAVIHGDFVQQTPREKLDESHEDVIAHELFHHWFGDLVTSEAWAQITMNESFATYGEYLWKEHKYGEQDARYHLLKDYQRYLSEAAVKPKTLVRYHYNTPDDVFDSHSYQKGGLILHMLRNEVGDKGFFKAMNTYLVDNAFGCVEDDHFRLALEKVTGKDWRWFFDTWYYQKGHPKVNVSYEVDSATMMLHIQLDQEQKSDALFKFHANLVVADQTKSDTFRFWIDERSEQFQVPIKESTTWFAMDPNHDVLWELREEKDASIWLSQLQSSKGFHPMIDAMEMGRLEEVSDRYKFQSRLHEIIDQPEKNFFYARYKAVENLFRYPLNDTAATIFILKKALQNDPSSDVRSVALYALDSLSFTSGLDTNAYISALNDESFQVMRAGLSILLDKNPCLAKRYATQFDEEERKKLVVWLSRLHAACGHPGSMSFFRSNGASLEGFERFLFNTDYFTYTKKIGTIEAFDEMTESMASMALNVDSWWARLSAIQALEGAIEFYEAEIQRLESKGEITTDQIEQVAKLRNKKANLAAIVEEAVELQGSEDGFISE